MLHSLQTSKSDEIISISLTCLIVIAVLGLMYMIHTVSYNNGKEDGKNLVYSEARQKNLGDYVESGTTFKWNEKRK